MRYLITIEYDGTNFYGFQRLKNKRSIQQEVENALKIIDQNIVLIKGAGRTDKGVHAYGQRASFDLQNDIPCEHLKRAMNSLLPRDIYISECIKVDNDFHARFNVIEKTYIYKINVGPYDPLLNNYYYFYGYKIDMGLLKKCAKLFLGIHHFDNFVSGSRDNAEAIIYNIKIIKRENVIEIKFVGKSFYRYMVRNLVGAMLDVSTGKATLDQVKMMLNEYQLRKNLNCAPANGLYLMNIKY
jgi:tRNA pseudouridine38-40 synthase